MIRDADGRITRIRGGDIRLIAFITETGPIRKMLTYLGEPLEPPPISHARGPPSGWGELVQVHDDRDVFQASPDKLAAIDIDSLSGSRPYATHTDRFYHESAASLGCSSWPPAWRRRSPINP